MMGLLTSVVLSNFHIVSILLSVLRINLAPFLQDALNDNEKLNVDQFWVLKGLNQSNKIGMLHKMEGKTLISLGSLSPSSRVLPCCFIQDVLPNPLPPLYFILVAIHKLLIGTWCIPSPTVPVAIQTSFVFLCACSVETYAAAPATISLG